MRAFARYVRSLNPKLPRAVWLLQAGGLANMFGNGVVVPYLVIYLHNVRGISLGLAGLIAAANGAAALVSGPIAGALADRIGARTTLVAALVIMAVAFALFPLITTALARVPAERARRDGERRLLAQPGNAPVGAHARRPAARGVRTATRDDEPGHRARRPRRWTDREHERPVELHGPVRGRRGHLPRVRRDPDAYALPADRAAGSTNPRAATPRFSGTGRSARSSS